MISNQFSPSIRTINMLIFAAMMCIKSIGDAYIAHNRRFFINDDWKHYLLIGGFVFMSAELLIASKKTKTEKYILGKEILFYSGGILLIVFITLIYILMSNKYSSESIKYLWNCSSGVLYAFFMLNTFSAKNLERAMKLSVLIFWVGFLVEKGITVFSTSNFALVSFVDSTSPFESNYSAGPSYALFGYFLYNKKGNKAWFWLSLMLVMLTFKRMLMVSAVVLLIIAWRGLKDKKIKKSRVWFASFTFVLLTVVMSQLFKAQNAAALDKLLGISLNKLTMTRVALYNMLLNWGFKSSGIGSTHEFMNVYLNKINSIELELLQIYLEVGLIGLCTMIFMYMQFGRYNLFCHALISLQMINVLLSSGLAGPFTWILILVTIGSTQIRENAREICDKGESRLWTSFLTPGS